MRLVVLALQGAILLLPAAYVLLLRGRSEASPRFRVIYTPLLCLLAGAALQACLGWLRSVRKRTAAGRPLALEGRPPAA